jgi:hypothetical protein
MPIHDWVRVDAGIFHDFHLSWIDEIKRALNRGLLPAGYYALAEQMAGRLGPDVLSLKKPGNSSHKPEQSSGGVQLATAPPKVRYRVTSEQKMYARKTRTVTIRHVSRHQIVAMIELISPGNKSSSKAVASFVRKTHEALSNGIHLLIVDLFPPNARNPRGIHPLIWDERDYSFKFSKTKPLTCVAYTGDPDSEAFIEPVKVGDVLPDMPLFLTSDEYVYVPLEKTYESAWEAVPDFWRNEIEKQK